jgi:hypothetical protein
MKATEQLDLLAKLDEIYRTAKQAILKGTPVELAVKRTPKAKPKKPATE